MDQPPRGSSPYWEKPKDKDNLAIDCWLYEGTQPVFNSGMSTDDEIESWLRKPSPTSDSNDEQPSADLKLICQKQETSATQPFQKATLRAINDVVGLPASHTYLTMHHAGVCGKFTAKTNQPGALQYVEYVLMHVY
jgi:hypothetical protein